MKVDIAIEKGALGSSWTKVEKKKAKKERKGLREGEKVCNGKQEGRKKEEKMISYLVWFLCFVKQRNQTKYIIFCLKINFPDDKLSK